MRLVNESVWELSYEDVLAHIKNRPPMLMIQGARVVPGKWAAATVALTGDEWYFASHFPGNPLVPGVLQLETLFNTAALAVKTMEGMREKTSNISRIGQTAFHFPISPGKVMEARAELVKPYRRGVAWFHGEIIVDGEIACAADFSLSIPEDMVIKEG